MDFELSETHKMIRSLVRDFAENEVKPKVKELEKEEFPNDLVKRLGELGLMGIFVPEQYGGMGADTLAYAIAEEELARISPALGLIMSANNSLSINPILEFGTEAQRQKYLVPLAKGEKLGCLALTEPEAGSDLASAKSPAKKEGELWKISGTKSLITNASVAQVCVFLARTGEDPHKGLTTFIIETNTPGFAVTKIEKKMGLPASLTAEITLTDCQVPEENILGGVGNGFDKVAMKTLDAGRINIAAQAVGTAQGAFDLAWAYVQERKQFGQPLIKLSGVQSKLARMATKIEAARLLTYKAAWLKDRGQSFVLLASMAKLFASEAAEKVASTALHLHGGYGYLKDLGIERYYRDAPVMQIYEGTSEIQEMTIVRTLLGKYQ